MSINISELIWTVICFFVLLVVLKKLLFDPLVSFMAARDARIQDGLNAGRTAQQQLDAAARARSEAQRKQAAAADALLAEAKSAAERIHDAAGHFFAHGHGHDLPRAAHAVALLQVTVGPEQDDADVLAAEVHDHAAQRAVKGQ